MRNNFGRVMSLLLILSIICIFPNYTKASNSNLSSEDGKLIVWMYESFNNEANALSEQRVKAFEEAYNVTVEFEWITEQSYLQKYNAAVEAGETPDVSYVRSDFVLQSYPNIYIKKLDDLAEKINSVSPFVKGYLDLATVDSSIYIIPMFTSAQPVIYRKDLFAEAGYDIFPETWAELASACKIVPRIKILLPLA